MTIGSTLLELLEKIEDEEYTAEMKAKLKRQIKSAESDFTLNPRDKSRGNQAILNATMLVALGTARDLYGVSEDIGLHPILEFADQPYSQVAPLRGDNGTVGIVLGNQLRNWEHVFYDIFHESLHLLNPIINVNGCGVKVSSLEEGVAVKFAEMMYERHIKPYCDEVPPTSPIRDLASQYFKAYSAAKKIPDDILKKTRSKFGKFSNIGDADQFVNLVGEYVSDDEIKILIAPFRYR